MQTSGFKSISAGYSAGALEVGTTSAMDAEYVWGEEADWSLGADGNHPEAGL